MTEFLTKPRIELIGKSVFDIDGLMKFLDSSGFEWPEFQKKLDSNMDLGDHDNEYLIEFGGRNCYQSWPKKGGELKGRTHEQHIKHLIEVGHGSCLEHSTFNFQIWNVSRSLTHELVRTRVGVAYSQLSQRYVDSSNINFIVPPAILELEKVNQQAVEKWKQFCLQSRDLYEELTSDLMELYKDIEDKTEKRKRSRESARSVLPNCAETKIMVTLNGRSVRTLMELRGSQGADREIRMLAVEMFKIMERDFPLIVHGMSIIKLPDGSEGIESKFRKV